MTPQERAAEGVVTEPETPDEAYMRLLAQPLSERIAELEQDQAANDWPRLLSSPEVTLYIEHLRELRARRRAMKRDPDDNLNAPADLCTCAESVSRQMRCGPVSHGCPMHPPRVGACEAGP
jgi:hypothetical protein